MNSRVSRRKKLVCSYCKCRLVAPKEGQRACPANLRTKDHILSQCMGRLPQDVFNCRVCCRDCNQLRANLGHCTGLLLIATQEAKRNKITTRKAAELLMLIRPKGLPRKNYVASRWEKSRSAAVPLMIAEQKAAAESGRRG